MDWEHEKQRAPQGTVRRRPPQREVPLQERGEEEHRARPGGPGSGLLTLTTGQDALSREADWESAGRPLWRADGSMQAVKVLTGVSLDDTRVTCKAVHCTPVLASFRLTWHKLSHL